MPTYNGWTVIAAPATPAPQLIEFTRNNTVALSISPFTGQQQVQDWGGNWLEADVTMPPMTSAVGQVWVDFLMSLNGVASVFQFTNDGLAALVPTSAGATGYWRLKANSFKWGIKPGLIYGMSFQLREAK